MSVNSSPAPRDVLPQIDLAASQTVSRKTSHNTSRWLQDEIASRMAQRLSFIRQPPTRWIDWEPRTGGLASLSLVQNIYPKAKAIAVQPCGRDVDWLVGVRQPRWWQWWKRHQCEYAQSHELAADMLWSNLCLHQHARPLELMMAWSQALNPQGFVMFSCLGPDSLRELRELYRLQSWPEPHHAFTDMHDWGDMLLEAGFSQPVMDMERLTLTYDSADELLQDLRAWGRNLHPLRYPGTRTKAWRAELLAQLSVALASNTHPGKLVLSLEIIYGHAFKAAVRHAVKPLTQVALSDMRRMLQSPSA